MDAAFDALRVGFEHLLKLVEDRALEEFDNTELVGFFLEFERFRNRLPLVDHQMIGAAGRRDLPGELCQSSLVQMLTGTLRISPAEAARRVRAAESLGERMSMLGEPLAPERPHLAAAQRDGDVSPEQVDMVARALGKVAGPGFDPADVEAGERILADYAAQLGPRDLGRLADRVVDGINPDGTRPDDRLQADRRHLTLRPTRDGGFAGEFRLTAEAGVKLQAVLGPLTRPQITTVETEGGRRVEEPDPRSHGQRMHDALEAVCDRLLRANTAISDTGGTPATVIVTLDLNDLLDKTGHAVAGDGTLIPTGNALAMADQAEIYWTAVNSLGVPLQLGRTRRIASAGRGQ